MSENRRRLDEQKAIWNEITVDETPDDGEKK